MAYSDFNPLEKARLSFGLSITDTHLFSNVTPITPSESLQSFLNDTLELATAIATEKARSELIIAPILIDVRKIYRKKIGFFSGKNFTVDAAQGLNGEVDFMLTASPVQSIITAPVVTIVEAKNDNINSGLGQCVAQMYGSWLYNQREGTPIEKIYGAVSTGTIWKFLALCDKRVEIDLSEYYINQIEYIIGILCQAFSKMIVD